MRIALALPVIAALAASLPQAAGLTPQDRAKIDDSNKACLRSSGAEASQLAQIRSGRFADDARVQKYFGCMLRSIGVINAKGKLQVKVLRTKIPQDVSQDEAMKIYVACKDKKGGNVDETAYLLYKCFWEASPKHVGLDGM